MHEYRAERYGQAQLDIIRKNRGFRFIPGLFRTEKDANRFIVETYSDLHYTHPNIYDQKIKAYTGTLKDARELPGITDYFNVNVYAPYLLGERLLSPLAPNSDKYYRYVVDSVSCDSLQRLEYRIRFIPRNKSFQLIEGQMTITEGAWSIRDMSFKGRFELLTFESHIQMGDIGTDKEYLPVQININASFAFAYNVMEGYYEAHLAYTDIRHKDNTPADSITRHDYNLTASFALQCDRKAYTRDFARFDTLRPVPLSSSEAYIYKRYEARNDSIKHQPTDSLKASRKRMWGTVGDLLLTDSDWKLAQNATLRNSPFINPLLVSYSKTIGTAYRQDLKLNTLLRNGQSLHVGARLGYNFTHKEFYWSVNGEYLYSPERQGWLRINVGNGNRIANSRIIDLLCKRLDALENKLS